MARDDTPDAHAADADAVDEVVTCFLRHRGEVLLVRRSGRVGSYRGRWGAVSGFAEGDPLEAAWREIAEETGLEGAVTLVKRGEPFGFEDAGERRRWRVNPFLFDTASREAKLDWEAEEGVWVSPVEILERDTVPRLWTSYERVGPGAADLRADREHGSAWLSLRALEALRDRAAALAAGQGGGEGAAGGEAGGRRAREALAGLARELIGARPAMTAVRTRVHRAMTRALADAGPGRQGGTTGGGVPGAVRDAAEAALREAIGAEEGAVREAARAAAGRHVMTFSSSGTVAEGLLAASPKPGRVIVCESRPGGEGRALAVRLAGAGLEVALVPDAAVAWALDVERVELLLVGADTVLADGSVVNKVGTRPAALAARAAGVTVLAAASTAKVAARGETWSAEREEHAALEPDDGTNVGAARPGAERAGRTRPGGAPERPAPAARGSAAGPAWGVRLRAPLFERTPADLIDGVLTERGVLGRAEVAAVAADHAAERDWDPGST